MDLRTLWEKRKIEITGIFGLLLATVINLISQTYMIYLFTVVALILTIYASRKFKNQFGAKLFFTRSEGLNYWSGAFAGVLAFTMSMYAQSVEAGFARVIAEITAITVFVMLMTTLFYGSILQDIQSGEIEL
jgi:hypothetical protein